jgi:hypothetical protein
MIGRRFDHLEVVAATTQRNGGRHTVFLCRCHGPCGDTKTLHPKQGNHLRNRRAKSLLSCGCVTKPSVQTRAYRVESWEPK